MIQTKQTDTPLTLIGELINDHANATIQMLTDYATITKRAKNGVKINSSDYNNADEQFNEKIISVQKRLNELLKGENITEQERENAKNVLEQSSKEIVERWKNKATNVIETIDNPKPLVDAFAKNHAAEGKKRVIVPAGNNVEDKELISTLLEYNNGIALGEIHTKADSVNFIYSNIDTLKNSKVDAIYLEMNAEKFAKLSSYSAEELKSKIDAVTPEQSKINAERQAKERGTEKSDDLETADFKMFLAAKENGIKIVNIDTKGEARKVESDLDHHRIASTNYKWIDAISEDRKNKPQDGKYIVLGGKSHFTISENNTKGLVDEALGLPVISFDNRDGKGSPNRISFGQYKHGADLYLPSSSNDIPDYKTHIEAMAIKSDLKDDFNKYKKELSEEIRNQFNALLDKLPSFPRFNFSESSTEAKQSSHTQPTSPKAQTSMNIP